MKAISTQARLTSLLAAILASATVLGATVAGMQPDAPHVLEGQASRQEAAHHVVVLEHVTVRPTAVQ